MSMLRSMLVVAGKDLRSEIRSRQNVITVLFFAIVVLVIFHFAFDLEDVDGVLRVPPRARGVEFFEAQNGGRFSRKDSPSNREE